MIEPETIYEVIDGAKCAVKVENGLRVIHAPYYDFGLANDDTRITGEEHVSVVPLIDRDGSTFTTPVTNLRRLDVSAPNGVKAVLDIWKRTTRPFFGFDCVHAVVIASNCEFHVGDRIYTSSIVELDYDDLKKEGVLKTGSGSTYLLRNRAP